MHEKELLSFKGKFRFYEFNSFEGSGRTELLELDIHGNEILGWLHQSDRYDTLSNFPRNYEVKGSYNNETDLLELSFKKENDLIGRLVLKWEENRMIGNYPEENHLWGEWEKV